MIGSKLPRAVAVPLFGDRRRWGRTPDPLDQDWASWQATYLRFHEETQHRAMGSVITSAGYRILSGVPFAGRRVLEIGAGTVAHRRVWNGTPASYTVADVNGPMLDAAHRALPDAAIVPLTPGTPLPFPDHSFDVVVSFYVMEHVDQLEPHVGEIARVLTADGVLAGGIPCEGGIAWGLGRYATTRRWFKRHTTIDPDKVICWEHPNFADHVLRVLDGTLQRRTIRYWPLAVPSIDLNLIVSFLYGRP